MESDNVIIDVVRRLQRTYTGVFPWQVQMWLPFGISEGYTRKTMVRLWQEGRLHRIGGDGARRGYRVMRCAPRLQIVRQDGCLRMVA